MSICNRALNTNRYWPTFSLIFYLPKMLLVQFWATCCSVCNPLLVSLEILAIIKKIYIYFSKLISDISFEITSLDMKLLAFHFKSRIVIDKKKRHRWRSGGSAAVVKQKLIWSSILSIYFWIRRKVIKGIIFREYRLNLMGFIDGCDQGRI